MSKHDFPRIRFYDQDFVDIYNKTWAMLADFWIDTTTGKSSLSGKFLYPDGAKFIIDQFESIFSSFFLVYSNRNFNASSNIDYFYHHQEKDGAIRWRYDAKTGKPIFTNENPQGVGMPLFAWAEFNLYHKTANKRRVKDVVPILQAYMAWIDATFKRPNGLYAVPAAASTMFNSPRDKCVYPVDFNAAMALSASYMSALGDILNDKDVSFQYRRLYFSIKTRINSLMWDNDTRFYYDLDKSGERLREKTIAGFWPLLAELPNADKAERLIAHISDETTFGTDHPFPTLSADSKHFKKTGEGFCGSVFPVFNFMVIKGLEKYQHHELARECAIRHLYYLIEGFLPNDPDEKGDIYEAYLPCKEGKATFSKDETFSRPHYLITAGLSTIALMIENVVGLTISLPRKTVDWIIPNMEIMGIENLSLKRNLITILSNKGTRGWEIQMESEKLYYFTLNILGQKKKTLPIPSGKCSMFIDKL